MRNLDRFLKEIRQGTLAGESRKCIDENMTPDEKLRVLFKIAKENNYEVTYNELKEDLEMSDAKAFEQEILFAAEAGIAVEHRTRDYGWPFSKI